MVCRKWMEREKKKIIPSQETGGDYLEPSSLREILREEGFFISARLERALMTALATKPVAGAFLFGPPGAGKTGLVRVLAKVLEIPLVYFQCFPGTREDDLMIKLLPDPGTKSGIKAHKGVIPEAITLSKRGRVILLMDEWDKTRPSADAFLLDFLQQGSVRWGDYKEVADLSNLVVFLTSNQEREISEPLLRRLPLIEVPPPSEDLVRRALEDSHPGNPLIGACVKLYTRTLKAGLSKPATIQELRQLLDAINTLRGEADWHELVCQFVVKTEEDRILLSQYDPQNDEDHTESEAYRIDASDYDEEEGREEEGEEVEVFKPQLPKWREREAPQAEPEEQKSACGVLKKTDKTYDWLVGREIREKAKPSLPQDPHDLGGGKVFSDRILLKDPIPFTREALMSLPWGEDGEILLKREGISLEQVLSLRKEEGVKIVQFGGEEVLGRFRREDWSLEADFRWTKERGRLEVVCVLRQTNLRAFFKKWLSLFEEVTPKLSPSQSPPSSPYRRERLEWRRDFHLGDGLVAKMEIKKLGLLPPEEGDEVQVEASLLLPTDPEHEETLHSRLRFDTRVKIFDHPLDGYWGGWGGKGRWKSRERKIKGRTYREALARANLYVWEEVVRLQLALRRRRRALKEAEKSLEEVKK